ncbi:MAG: DUF2085 domain-containing protein [Thermoanaerobaculia bacterium]
MKRDTWILAAVLAAIAAGILSASTACSWVIAHGASMRWRLLFRMFCHGLPERCLILWGIPMPICARCTAIYGGLALAAVLFRLLPLVRERTARILLYMTTAPMALDGLTQLARLRESTNGLRLVTGFAAGIAFGIWALTSVESHDFAKS